MKTLVSTALITLLAATAAHAEVKVESRAYHSNLHVDGGKTTIDGEYAGKMNEAFFNSPGVGLSAIFASTDLIDLGVSYGIARFYPSTETHLDLQSTSGFTRLNFVNTEAGTFYVRAGLTSQDLDLHSNDITLGKETTKVSSNFTRILNWDAGIGGSIKLGRADLGLAYTYSQTLDKGRVSYQYRSKYFDLVGPQTDVSKVRVKGVTAETQELALTLGVRI